MNKPRFLDRRIGFSVGALIVMMGMVAPAVFPAFASAATLTSRSIDMSSSAASGGGAGTDVSYKLTFTPGTSIASASIVLWFCDNTPLVGSTCNAPAGMNLASATLVSPPGSEAILTTGTDTYQGAGANYLVFKGAALTASTAYTITIGGVTNPSSNETFYGRIETIGATGAPGVANAKLVGGDVANGGTANGTVTTGMVDNGSVALSTTNALGVQAAVLESLTFCLFGDPGNLSGAGSANNASDSAGYLTGTSTNVGTINSNDLDDIGSTAMGNAGSNLTNQAPGADCSDSTAATYAGGSGFVSPSVKLGQYVASGIYALNTSNVSYADDWSQLSTNASGGAVVYLQSGNSCTGGGLSLSGGSSCGIPGASGTLTAGTAGFGVALGTPVSLDSNPVTANDGSITASTTYNASGTPKYALGAATNGTYGDSFYNTGGAPATNWDVPIGIGASVGNNTAAGNYSDNLNLVAVGTF